MNNKTLTPITKKKKRRQLYYPSQRRKQRKVKNSTPKTGKKNVAPQLRRAEKKKMPNIERQVTG